MVMKHNAQPSQRIENESEDGYGNGMCVTITEYLPFVMVPFVSYLTIMYAHPMICFHLKKYLQKIDNSINIKQDLETKILKKWKALHLESLLQASYIIYFFLIISGRLDIPSAQYDNVDKGFLSNVDHYVSYIHRTLSTLVMIFLYAMMITGVFLKWRKVSFTTVISLSISINIIYMVCYFFPKILVSFTYDPVQATYTIFIAIIIIMSSYPLMWYYCLFFLFSEVFFKQASSSCKITLMVSAFCTLAIIFSPIIYLTSYSGYQYLLILHLMIALLVVCVYKYVDNCAYKHIIVNEMVILYVLDYDTSWAEDEEDNTISYTCTDQDFISQSNFNGIKEIDVEQDFIIESNFNRIKEIDVYLQTYESTIV